MSSSNQQIVTAFEVNQMSPEEISEELGYDIVSVKAILMQCSSAYRKLCNVEPENESTFNFSDSDMQMSQDVIVQTAQYADDQQLKFKAACYIRDDKKGRKEIVSQMAKVNISVVQFNIDIQKALQAKERAKMKKLVVNDSATLVGEKAA